MPNSSSRARRAGPIATSSASSTQRANLALEKVIQDHIPTVSTHLMQLLHLLRPATTTPPLSTRSKHSLLQFERELRKLCHQAQDGVRTMDAELRTIESGWALVDKLRWEVCRRDYKGVMKLVELVWDAGQERMEELKEVSFTEVRTVAMVGRAAAAAVP